MLAAIIIAAVLIIAASLWMHSFLLELEALARHSERIADLMEEADQLSNNKNQESHE